MTKEEFKVKLKEKVIDIITNSTSLRENKEDYLYNRESDNRQIYYTGKKNNWAFNLDGKTMSVVNSSTGDLILREIISDEELLNKLEERYNQLLSDEVFNKSIQLLDD